MLSRLVITFLPRSKCLLISWLQLPSIRITILFFFFSVEEKEAEKITCPGYRK